MTTFETLGLAQPILKAVTAEGYETPTPIQAKVIPLMLAQRDVIGIAQTGTGKTAAFVLPLLDRITRENTKTPQKQCKALILTPTRELASQIVENIRAYSQFSQISTTLIVGGVRPGGQIKALHRGVDIIVATPGRLLDHLESKVFTLSATKTIVIDEADQMLDLGFLPSIRKIMERLPKARLTALLSATMPTQIRKLANDFLTNPEQVQVAAVSKPIERIDQSVQLVEKSGKLHALATILAENEVFRAVVFTRTKRGADRVCKHLIGAGINAVAIHGNKSQNQRDRAMAGFRAGDTTVLVATDIAARGIDIDDVSHVVNYELPNVPESYVHRIGRTARAGRTGTAVSLVDSEEIGLLRDIEKLIGNKLPGSPDTPAGAGKSGKPKRPQKPRPAKAGGGQEPGGAKRPRRGRGSKPKGQGQGGGKPGQSRRSGSKKPAA